jgi:hypothetical protein
MKTNVKENQMKAASQTNKRVVFAAILACLIVVGSGSAFAQEVLLTTKAQILSNTCPGATLCSGWGYTVSTDEPSSAEPVAVIWSTRYWVNTPDAYNVGLSVNGGECQIGVYGPQNLDDFATLPAGHFLTATFQWIVEASELKAGTSNTFEVCGGGSGSVSGDKITIEQNTLSVAKY